MKVFLLRNPETSLVRCSIALAALLLWYGVRNHTLTRGLFAFVQCARGLESRAMKRGKELRDPKGQPTTPEAPKEVPVLMFVMVEKAPCAFALRLVCNEDVLEDIRNQGALDTLLVDIDELYADFRRRFGEKTPQQIN